MDGPRPDVHRLPVWATIGEAVQALTNDFEPLLKAIALPALVVAAVNVAFQRGGGGSLMVLPLLPLSTLGGIIIAVSCHRLVLLGTESLPSSWGLYWTWRETRFLGWTFGIGLIMMAGMVVGLLAVGLVAGLAYLLTGPLPESVLTVGALAAVPFFMVPLVIAMTYAVCRLSLVLPAVAIGEHPTLKESWRLSRSNGWRLALVIMIPSLVLFPLSIGGSLFLPGSWAQFVSAFMVVVLSVLGVAALSKAYAWFTEHAPVEADLSLEDDLSL